MSVNPQPDPNPLTPAQALKVDRACDEYEASWRGGHRPSIEHYLDAAELPLRVPLLGAMLALELELRLGCGECPTPGEYRDRFPAHAELVTSVCEGAMPRRGLAESLDWPATRAESSEQGLGPATPGSAGRDCVGATSTVHRGYDVGPRATLGRLGDYELLDVIAEGGMGVVYRARHVPLDRHVALKMLRSGGLASSAERERLRREALAVAGLDHPNILPIYEVGELAGRPYLSMKLIEGGTLADRVQSLLDDPALAARMLGDVARAVHHAHSRGVLHRDLKPSNILLTRDGRPLVTDFGLAKKVGEDLGMTGSNVVLGTPCYMAPEQASSRGREVTAAADVYGLGSILYELLAGRPPFRAGSIMETLIQVLELAPQPPRQIRPGACRDLELICLKCLEKDPGLRYPSAIAVAEDLKRFLAGDVVEASHLGAWRMFRRWVRRQPRLAFGLWDLILVEALSVAYAMGGSPLLAGKLGAMTIVLTGWAATKVALQGLTNAGILAALVPPAWVVVDAAWFAAWQAVVSPPAGWLAVGFLLLIVLSGLWARVGLVWIASAASVVSYLGLLAAIRPEEVSAGPNYFVSLVVGAMALTGNAVAYLVRRFSQIGSYLEKQARGGSQ